MRVAVVTIAAAAAVVAITATATAVTDAVAIVSTMFFLLSLRKSVHTGKKNSAIVFTLPLPQIVALLIKHTLLFSHLFSRRNKIPSALSCGECI